MQQSISNKHWWLNLNFPYSQDSDSDSDSDYDFNFTPFFHFIFALIFKHSMNLIVQVHKNRQKPLENCIVNAMPTNMQIID